MPSGPRIRSNSEFGLITDNPLTAGATTFNSARLVLMPVVSAAHAVVTLDPRAINGEPEIVIITSHTAAATVATITRAAYGTVARSHPVDTEWIHAPVDEDFIEVVTSITRPTDPYEGQFIYETDTDRTLRYGGTNWSQYRLGQEPDQFFTLALSNGTATSFTDFVTNNSILALPYPYTMVVEASINSGGNGAGANIITVQVRDELGNSINFGKTVIDVDWRVDTDHTDQFLVWHVIGKKDYAAGATCGFRLAYKVNTTNIFMDGSIRVSFSPRVS